MRDPKHLKAASDAGDLDEVRKCVEAGVDVNHGHRPSFLGAYFNGHLDVVRYLLENGGDVNHNGHSEVTLLMAAVNQQDIEFAPDLVQAGADVNLTLPRGGEAALHKAAVNNRPRSARFLIDHGADVNLQAMDGGLSEMPVFGELHGETPLHIAAVRSDKQLIELLIQAGAVLTIRTTGGQLAYDLAVAVERDDDIVNMLRPPR